MALFGFAELASIARAQLAPRPAAAKKSAQGARIRTRHVLRRAKSEAVLAGVLPAELEPDTSYHVISAGDVDSLSFLRHIVRARPLTYVAISTWVAAMEDIREIERWLDSGRVEVVDWYVGEIFPNQYGDEMAAVRRLSDSYGGRVVIARNHSKVMLVENATDGFYAAIESSANMNTNPRIEQSAVHVSEPLYRFYREFFDGLNTIHLEPKPKRQPGGIRAPS